MANSPLINFSKATSLIFSHAAQMRAAFKNRSELVSIEQSVGRVCSENITSRESVPSFDNSSMDGFAVRAEETFRATSQQSIQFEVQQTILAGDQPLKNPVTDPLACYEIMTGAPIPTGFNAVYKIEDVEVTYNSQHRPISILVRKIIDKHEHFREKGSDFLVGTQLLGAGTILMPEHIMAMASVGVSEVRVLRKPRIAVLSTGSELVDPADKDLPEGKIRNSTASYLKSAIPLMGAEIRYYGRVNDERSLYRQKLEEILNDPDGLPDVVLTTGAVSKGTHDFIPEVIRELGAEVVFHNVAIRPGKPQLFAKFKDEGPAFFGIPGNPISTAVGLRFFVNTYLRGLIGLPMEAPLHANLTEDAEKPSSLRCFFKARTEISTAGTSVTSLAGQPSFMVSSLLQANCWLMLEESPEMVLAGSLVSIFPLYPVNPPQNSAVNSSGAINSSGLSHAHSENDSKGCC